MIPEIDIQAAADLLGDEGTVYVDVRDPNSYSQARIPGAIAATPENIEALLARITPETAIVVYCYHGNSSKSATQWFHSQGFTGAKSMAGGFESWRMAALNGPAFQIEAG